MMTPEEMKKKLLADPLWQPEETADEDVWALYDEVIAEINKSRKVVKVKPDIDEIFDDTFPTAVKSRHEDDDF